MFTFEKNIFINRPPQEVWDFLTNPANNSQWESSTKHAEWTSEGPPGVGSTYRSFGKLFGRDLEVTSEITTWDPPIEHGHKATSGLFPLEVTMKYEPKENGTQLNVHLQGELGGFFKIAEGLLVKQSSKMLDADFEALKRFLEEGQA